MGEGRALTRATRHWLVGNALTSVSGVKLLFNWSGLYLPHSVCQHGTVVTVTGTRRCLRSNTTMSYCWVETGAKSAANEAPEGRVMVAFVLSSYLQLSCIIMWYVCTIKARFSSLPCGDVISGLLISIKAPLNVDAVWSICILYLNKSVSFVKKKDCRKCT